MINIYRIYILESMEKRSQILWKAFISPVNRTLLKPSLDTIPLLAIYESLFMLERRKAGSGFLGLKSIE